GAGPRRGHGDHDGRRQRLQDRRGVRQALAEVMSADPGTMPMTAVKHWVTEAEAILRESPVRVLRDVPLRTRTSLGVGGEAPLLLAPARPEQLAPALARLFQAGVPFAFL